MHKETGLTSNWKKIIKNKKVILYNTSVSSLLKDEGRHIDKMKEVLEIFQNQEEIALWWRPHPLELSTIEAMRPKLAEKYKSMRTAYEEAGWGVLDTSADLNRAIAISDAYYGDWSSLIYLYRAIGKPILHQNGMISNNSYKNYINELLDIIDFVIVGREMWFINASIYMLFRMNMDTGVVDKMIELPEDYVFQKYAECNITYSDGYLILFPGNGQNIIRIELQTEKIDILKIKEKDVTIKYRAIYYASESAYLFPLNYNKILKYNISENIVSIEKESNCNFLFSHNIVADNKWIYLVSRKENKVFKYAPEERELVEIHIDDSKNFYGGIIKFEDWFVIPSLSKKEIILWNESTNQILKLDLEKYNYLIKNIYYLAIDLQGVYLFPSEKSDILYINMETKEVKRYEKIKNCQAFSCVKMIDNKMYAYSRSSMTLYVISNNGEIINQFKLYIEDDIIKYVFAKNILENGYSDSGFEEYENNSCFSLLNFIACVIKSDESKDKSLQLKKCGKDIHRIVVNI